MTVRALTVGMLVGLLLSSCGISTESSDATSPSGPPGTAIVVRVVDGDTVRVRMGDNEESVRLIGVDTPETVDPRRPVGCYGKEASDFTKTLLPPGEAVRMETDIEERDRYDRLLVYLYRSHDNLFVNAELARQGYANVLTIPPNVAHQHELVALVAEARSRDRGLWGACSQD